MLMRLPKRFQTLIKQTIQDSFGVVDIYLFGSRTDDSKKGGDIDIAIDSHLTKEVFREKKIQTISSLFKNGFDLKIDLVQYHSDDSFFTKEIKNNSIML